MKDEDWFFDARDNITSVADSGSDEPVNLDSDLRIAHCVPGSNGYKVWIKTPASISECRKQFLKWMGFGAGETMMVNPENASCGESTLEMERITRNSGAILRTPVLCDGGSINSIFHVFFII